MSKPFKTVSKYRAKPTGGYASKLEARYAADLEVRKASGELTEYLEQVPVKLPGGIVYRVDFMLIMANGDVRFVECKGFETAEWKLKMRLLADARPEIFNRLEVVR